MLKSDKELSKKTIIDRCLEIFNVSKKDISKNIFFVFGTEVPIAGGGTIKKIEPTKLQSIKEQIEHYKKLRKNFSLVIEPGIGFQNKSIKTPNLRNFKKISNFSKKKYFSFEAHSTDYQSLASLKMLIKNNFKFLKVGPELTYNYLKAILMMEKLEKNYYKKNCSLIKKTLLLEMNKDKSIWNKYYKKNINFLKLNSLLDRARYFWNKKNVINSKNILIKNINNMDTKIILKKLKKRQLISYQNLLILN